MKNKQRGLLLCAAAVLAAGAALAGCQNASGGSGEPPGPVELMAREEVTGAATLDAALDSLLNRQFADMTNYRIDVAAFSGNTLTARKRALEIPASAEGVKYIGVTLYNSVGGGKTLTLAKSGAAYEDEDKGSLFTVGKGVIFTLDGAVTLDGLTESADGANNNAPLVTVNAGGVLIMSGAARITGNTNKPPDGAAQGGGVKLTGASLVMRDSAKIDGNSAVFVNASALAHSYGGGIYAAGDSAIEMRGNSSVTGNTVKIDTTRSYAHVYGGGIYITNGSLLMTDSAAVTLNTVTAGHQPAAATPTSQAYGGGISADISSLLIKDNAKVEGNRAESYVGGTDPGGAANGGGIVLFSSSLLKLQGNAAVRNNTAQAVTAVTATPRASAAGGGIFVRLSMVEMDGGSISGNKALGGAASAPAGYVQGAQIYGKGGGIYVMSGAAYVYMRGGEISGNTAAAGTIPAEAASPYRTATNNSESAGGGIYSESNLYLSGGVIRDNVAGSAAGASPGMGGAVAKFGTSGSIHLSGAIRIPYNNTPLNGNEDRRNAVAVQMASTMANTTANHQNAPILIDGAFTVTEPVVADIRSYTAGGAVTDFAANGARALFWWRDGTVRPPLPGRVTLGRFYELNSTTSSADYYRFNPTDISASYELNGEGKVQAR